MNNATIRRVAAIISIIIGATVALYAQDVTLTDSASFSGNGTFNVRGDIILDSTVTGAIPITGATRLVGADSQRIGLNAKPGAGLHFDGLSTDSTGNKTLHVPVTVKKVIALNQGTLAVNGNTLTIDSAAAHTGGALSASGANDAVVYDGAGGFTQSILKATYKKLTLTNTAAKILLDTVIVDTLTHTGGGLGVNHDLIVNAMGSIATIDSATAELQFNGTAANTIQTVASARPAGAIVNNSSDSLTIATINGNGGTISTATGGLHVGALAANSGTIKTTGAGFLRFAGAAVNDGVISDSGASGPVTFVAALNNNIGGRVVGGAGGVSFGGVPNNAGTITADAGTLAFTDSTINSGTIHLALQAQAAFTKGVRNTGTLSAKDTAAATFNENFNGAGTLAFSDNSTARFQGTTNVLPQAMFANLVLIDSNKTAQVTDTITGNLALNGSNLSVDAGKAVVIASEPSKVSGTGEVIGSVKRTHAFTQGKFYAFNKDTVGMALDTNMTPLITLTMLPDSTFLTPSPSVKYIQRRFAFSADAPLGAARLKTLALAYTKSERSGAVTDESRLGVRSDIAGAWKKVTNPGGYSRVVDTVNHIITLANLASPLAGVSEFGIINAAFVTIADNVKWGSGASATWDEGSAPTITDDAEINNVGIQVDAAAFAASVTVNAGKSLQLTNTSLQVAGLFDMNGSLQVDPGTTLSLSNNLRIHGPVTNNGTINVGQ